MEKQTSVAEKQYQKSDNVFESNKKGEVKTKSKKITFVPFTNITKLKNSINVLLIQN